MKSDKKPYDTAFKRLTEQDPEALLRLIGALPAGAVVRILPREISAPALATDQPYEIIGENLHYIAHLEAQVRWKVDVPQRILEYDALFWINFHLPVRSFVLVLMPAGLPPDAPTQAVVNADGLTLIAQFTIVRLWELSAAAALALDRESLLPFIPLMQGGEAELEHIARQVGRVTDEAQQRELALHFVMLGSLRYNRENLLDLIGRMTMIPQHILRETPYFQEIIAEGREEGREEGWEEARELIVEMLLHAIATRFPQLDVRDEIARIRNPERLKQIFFDLDHLTDAASLQQHLAELSRDTQ